MAFVYIPNGVNTEKWRIRDTGPGFQLSPTLQPLEPLRNHVQILSGLTHDKARPNGDGGGDHARANASFLTGCQARKTAGADIRAGTSVDQVAAGVVGRETRLPSLELSCDEPRLAGNCDSGYSCTYQFNLAWRSESTPMVPERDPRQVFDRLFGNESASEEERSRAIRDYYDKSILDFVMEDAAGLRKHLGRTDQGKLDQYLDSLRDVERRIEAAGRFEHQRPEFDRPTGIPGSYGDHIRLMYDLIALSFQTDTTRIATFLLAHDGSNRSFSEVGVSEGHHSISHHQDNAEKLEQIARIDRFYIDHFAYFLDRLRSTPDGESGESLLDQSMIVYGGGIADGNRHDHHDLPIVLAGGGGGTLQTGRHVRFPDETPMANLYVSMLDRMGAKTETFGDSTGRLEDI